ncbi:hypothetical protein [Azorhizobium sp. AG788]|uniref:hypothetical protein n=1 Tax=Azorhizobium sp. AG788 TaxID=2183897 RepID=UPI00313A3E7B
MASLIECDPVLCHRMCGRSGNAMQVGQPCIAEALDEITRLSAGDIELAEGVTGISVGQSSFLKRAGFLREE